MPPLLFGYQHFRPEYRLINEQMTILCSSNEFIQFHHQYENGTDELLQKCVTTDNSGVNVYDHRFGYWFNLNFGSLGL